MLQENGKSDVISSPQSVKTPIQLLFFHLSKGEETRSPKFTDSGWQKPTKEKLMLVGKGLQPICSIPKAVALFFESLLKKYPSVNLPS